MFGRLFYGVRVNRYGVDLSKRTFLVSWATQVVAWISDATLCRSHMIQIAQPGSQTVDIPPCRRKVLIATLEYEILGWDIKVRYVER